MPGVQSSEDDANNNRSDDEVGFPSQEFLGMLNHPSNWLAIAINFFFKSLKANNHRGRAAPYRNRA